VDPVEPAAPPAPSAARPASAWRSPPVLALLLTTVLMAVAAGFVWYQVHQKDATESARKAGLETSRDAARVLFSYDYRTLDKDFSAGKAITTGAFQKSYGDTTSKVVAPVAKDKKAVVKAEVVAAGVVRATPSTVVTVVFVNQVTTSSLATAPKVDLSRVRMTLKHVGGRWLVSDVKAL
jgi:Mce-associated membrane protein